MSRLDELARSIGENGLPGLGDGTFNNQVKGGAPNGLINSKDEFWKELKQISQTKKQQRPQTGYAGGSNEGSSTQHGQHWINFELHGK